MYAQGMALLRLLALTWPPFVTDTLRVITASQAGLAYTSTDCIMPEASPEKKAYGFILLSVICPSEWAGQLEGCGWAVGCAV